MFWIWSEILQITSQTFWTAQREQRTILVTSVFRKMSCNIENSLEFFQWFGNTRRRFSCHRQDFFWCVWFFKFFWCVWFFKFFWCVWFFNFFDACDSSNFCDACDSSNFFDACDSSIFLMRVILQFFFNKLSALLTFSCVWFFNLENIVKTLRTNCW